MKQLNGSRDLFLDKVEAIDDLFNKPLNEDNLKKLLDECSDMARLLNSVMNNEEITSHVIRHIVNNYYGLNITEKSSKHIYVYPRYLAMKLSKLFTKESLAEIGKNIGGKDHATVIHGIRTIDRLISNPGEHDLRRDYNCLAKEIELMYNTD